MYNMLFILYIFFINNITDGLWHQVSTLHETIKDYELKLIPKDYNSMQALASELQVLSLASSSVKDKV